MPVTPASRPSTRSTSLAQAASGRGTVRGGPDLEPSTLSIPATLTTMRSFTRVLPALALAGSLACGSDSSTGPSFPNTAGTYATVFTITFSNSLETESASETGTITLASPASNGSFTGSYVITGGGSGVIAGTVRTDGGISIATFGDPNQDPLEAVQYLQNVFYWCNFSVAAGSPMNGSLAGNRLSLSGNIVLPCSYTTQTVSSTISISVSGTR